MRNRIVELEKIVRRMKEPEAQLRFVYRKIETGEYDQAKEVLGDVLSRWPLS